MISGISSSISSMASSLFSRLDTRSQGYIEKSDLESAFEQLSSSGSSSVDEVFSTLDGDSDGKVTESELTISLTKLAEQLDSQFNALRMSQGGPGAAGGMPPPPPPEEDEGFTQEELQTQLEDIGGSDSRRSSLISSIVQNFDEADTDGDGKVSFKEAMAYDQSASATSSSALSTGTVSSASGTDSSSSGSSSSSNNEFAVMLRIMQLAQSYGAFGESTRTGSVSTAA